MELDPTTVCLRSFAGEDEVRKATHGLSLVQRRILMLLDRPRTLVAFAALHHLEPRRFERDLLRLAELGLVKLLSPAQAIELANMPQSGQRLTPAGRRPPRVESADGSRFAAIRRTGDARRHDCRCRARPPARPAQGRVRDQQAAQAPAPAGGPGDCRLQR